MSVTHNCFLLFPNSSIHIFCFEKLWEFPLVVLVLWIAKEISSISSNSLSMLFPDVWMFGVFGVFGSRYIRLFGQVLCQIICAVEIMEGYHLFCSLQPGSDWRVSHTILKYRKLRNPIGPNLFFWKSMWPECSCPAKHCLRKVIGIIIFLSIWLRYLPEFMPLACLVSSS